MKKMFFIFLFVGSLLLVAACYLALPNNISESSTRPVLKIPTGSTFRDVIKLLKEKNMLRNLQAFELVARFKDYPRHVKPGHYVFNRSMSNRQLVNMLKSGNQVPVKLVIYNIRTKDEFVGLVGRTLEIDSTLLLKKLNDLEFCRGYSLDTNNILTAFVTDNYEFKWNTSIENFLSVMSAAHEKFWRGSRLAKAAQLGYRPWEIVTLASIVEKECVFDKELSTVAGVYINRLKCGMPLQADPTLVFALRDFRAKRVWNYHKEFRSPYNTYLNAGLPPGPICMPRKKSVDAVLEFEPHDYLYFCANPDLGGYSIFSKTLEEQNKNSRLYRQKMNEMGVH